MIDLKRVMLFIICLSGLLFPMQVFAHASLIEAVPAPDSHWNEPPTQVALTFNERLENQLFYIKVLDSQGDSIQTGTADMSEDQRKLTLGLPKLFDGIYTVTYKVISADGHPVEGSYVITVGDAKMSQPSTDNVHLSHQHELSGPMDIKQILLYVTRCLYFLSLLCVVGWTFWGMVMRFESDTLRTIRDTWSTMLQRIFLLSLLTMIGFQIQDFIDEWTRTSFLALMGTSIGISWISSLVLSIIGFYALNRFKAFDAAWIALLLVAKSINGHAMAFEPPIRTVVLDWFHLLAASVWAGGLLCLMILWYKDKGYAIQILPMFSKAAFISIITLVVSGIASTLVFLPQLKYVLYTQWGILLIIKTSLVLLVMVMGALIRRRLKKNQTLRGSILLKVDFTLMLLIVLIVGVFTYSNPLPANTPLYWHEMGQSVHMTAKISPNAPGNNSFEVIVWLEEEQESPRHVQLRMKYMDDPEVAPIIVPLQLAVENELRNSTSGYNQFDYLGSGFYLPFPGRWRVEVRVMDADDNEKVYTQEMLIY